MVIGQGEPGWGDSGNNGGQLNPGLKFDPDEIERIWDSDLGPGWSNSPMGRPTGPSR